MAANPAHPARRKSPIVRYSRKLRRALRRAADRYANGEPFDLGDIARPLGAGDALRLFAAGQTDLYLLQIGANDGTSTDPVNAVLRRGDIGACLVEPQPHVFAKLTETYSGFDRIRFENAAIADEDGEQPLYVLDGEAFTDAGMYLENLTGIASFDRRHIVEHVRRAAQSNIGFGHGIDPERFVRELKVATTSLDSLCARHGIERIDMLVIDTEGHDYEILKRVDFERFELGLVVYEHVNLSRNDRIESWRMLAGKGYGISVAGDDPLASRPTAPEPGRP
ncbi:MAG: FkbM family methyltransferase [Geminicoccaceae bacterium]